MQLSAVDLPQPEEGPEATAHELAAPDRQGHVAQGVHLTEVAADLLQPQLAEVTGDDGHVALLADLGANLLIPALERVDQFVRRQRHLGRHLGDQLRVE